jgi:hypothetical protein
VADTPADGQPDDTPSAEDDPFRYLIHRRASEVARGVTRELERRSGKHPDTDTYRIRSSAWSRYLNRRLDGYLDPETVVTIAETLDVAASDVFLAMFASLGIDLPDRQPMSAIQRLAGQVDLLEDPEIRGHIHRTLRMLISAGQSEERQQLEAEGILPERVVRREPREDGNGGG